VSEETVRVKICGLRTLEEALRAVEAGADLLGFNFYPPSPRYLTRRACETICSELEKRGIPAVRVGVFVNESETFIRKALDENGLHLAQLSGDEPAELLVRLCGRAFKALRPESRADLEQMLAGMPPRTEAPAYLVDASLPGRYGGTGRRADWELAAALAVSPDGGRRFPVLLAGGLTPQNVAQAVRRVHPWGVDVASGVESSPGVKDVERVRAFVLAARSALL
jgi:phosphoribosylanthranilate isomerase